MNWYGAFESVARRLPFWKKSTFRIVPSRSPAVAVNWIGVLVEKTPREGGALSVMLGGLLLVMRVVWNQLKFAMSPPLVAFVSMTTRMICGPASSTRLSTLIVWQVCQPPVFGIVM